MEIHNEIIILKQHRITHTSDKWRDRQLDGPRDGRMCERERERERKKERRKKRKREREREKEISRERKREREREREGEGRKILRIKYIS